MMFKLAATASVIWVTGQLTAQTGLAVTDLADPSGGVLELLVTQVPALAVLVYLVLVFLKDRRASEQDSRKHVESIVVQTTETAKECHAIQKESVKAMQAVTESAERLDETVDRLTRMLEKKSP